MLKTFCILGHCAQVSPSMFPMWYSGNYNYLSLDDQITHKLEFVKTILSKKSRLILMGHSIGAHMVLKLMEKKEIQKRVNYSVLLFPALEHLCLTPAGRFWTPVSKYGRLPLALLAHLVSYTPTWLKDIFIKWRAKGRPVHNKLLKACYSVIDYSCMNHALYMAATEMDGMNEMEESVKEVIRSNTDKLTFYYGNPDDWAPLTYYDKMKNKFPGSDIRLCKKGFPHDFVLDSSESVARMCSEILQGKVS